MNPRVVLFDVDGTLADSNYLHVDAWTRAFERVGHPVDAWRVHRAIGMDGDRLVATLRPDADVDVRARATELHTELYRWASYRLRPLDGGRELVERVKNEGALVVLASSASSEELTLLRRALEVDDLLDGATTSASVDTAKPEPDIVTAALDLVGARAEDAVMIGDSTWDMRAATRAGVTALAVLSGGTGRDELIAAGAHSVYDDPRDLLEHLDETPIRALLGR